MDELYGVLNNLGYPASFQYPHLNKLEQIQSKYTENPNSQDEPHTSSFFMSKSLSSSTPRYEKVRNVLFFLSSAATVGSVTSASA